MACSFKTFFTLPQNAAKHSNIFQLAPEWRKTQSFQKLQLLSNAEFAVTFSKKKRVRAQRFVIESLRTGGNHRISQRPLYQLLWICYIILTVGGNKCCLVFCLRNYGFHPFWAPPTPRLQNSMRNPNFQVPRPGDQFFYGVFLTSFGPDWNPYGPDSFTIFLWMSKLS